MNTSFGDGDSIKADPCNTQLRADYMPTNTESSIQPPFGKPVSKLRFLAAMPRYSALACEFRSRTEACEFTMGLGPCGRIVKGLWFKLSQGFLIITQESYAEAGQLPEYKEFTYFLSDITGRIEAISI